MKVPRCRLVGVALGPGLPLRCRPCPRAPECVTYVRGLFCYLCTRLHISPKHTIGTGPKSVPDGSPSLTTNVIEWQTRRLGTGGGGRGRKLRDGCGWGASKRPGAGYRRAFIQSGRWDLNPRHSRWQNEQPQFQLSRHWPVIRLAIRPVPKSVPTLQRLVSGTSVTVQQSVR